MEAEQKAQERLGAANTNKEYRQITLNRGRTEAGNMFPNNFISTGKYTVLTLIPKNLFEQFHRIANIWFLIVSILQILPLNLSPTSSWATIAPLSMVLTVSLIKDAYLDYRRHKSDREINNRKVKRWSDQNNAFVDARWQDLEVGNFIQLNRDEPCPVDILVLSTSEPNGVCYIETANLDGESNLKIKTGLPDTCTILSGANMEAIMKNVSKLDDALLKTEHPNNRLYTFEGSLKIKGHPKSTSVDSTNVILRGSTLKNTTWLIGAVVFTGPETKLMMNSKAPPHKRSNVERRVNKYLIIVFSVLFVSSLLSTVISIWYAFSEETAATVHDENAKKTGFLNFFTFMILYNGLVPISLYVTIDLVRVLQTRFIQWDMRMYFEEDDRPALAKTGDLNEDLGQIEFVFSDKTGTLTENQMQFKRCSVNGVKYGLLGPLTGAEPPSSVNIHEKFTFRDPNLLRTLQEDPEGSGLGVFVELMALCHTVIPEQDDSGHLRYQAASPDEEALAIAAHCFGYTFDNVRAGFCTALINNEKKEFKIIGVNDFSSSRKRMSIVLQPLTDIQRPAVLYCKGADNVVLELCRSTPEQVLMLNEHLREFSVDGLRTLVCAKRELTPGEVEEFETKWTNAKNAMSDRTKRLHEVAAEFEVNMEVVGVTAIEDKIQEGAPETIHALLRAGIKVWVLTGDKQETAINIGYGCKLLNAEQNILKVNINSIEEGRDSLKQMLNQYVFKNADPNNHSRVRAPSQNSNHNNTPANSPFMASVGPRSHHPLFRKSIDLDNKEAIDVDSINISVVVDGPSLNFIMEDAKCIKYFSILAFLSRSVVCCRVSPMQKSEMVRLVKRGFRFSPMTLAIGDGANDVSMIQEAHVGIGISGKEGLQAVNSSDYAIARFRFLQPLLFLHGRWNYQRITTVILYSFYKNFLLILPMFYYSFVNQYSGTALYDSYLIMSYNVALTSVPIIVLGVMDKDLPAEKVLAHPSLYTSGIMARLFNAKIFTRWVLMAIVQSLLIFGLIVMMSPGFEDSAGQTEGLLLTGTVAFYAVVQTVSYVICVEMKDWTNVFLIVLAVSYFLFYPFVFLYDLLGLPVSTMTGVFARLFTYPTMFFSMVLIPFLCTSLHLCAYYVKGLFWPDDTARYQKEDVRIHPEKEYMKPEDNILNFRPRQFASHISRIVQTKGLIREVIEDKDDYSMHPTTLEFNNEHLERAFKRFLVERSIKFIRRMFWCFFFFIVIWSIYDLTRTERTMIYIAGRVVVVVVLFAVVMFSRTHWFQVHYELCVLTIVGVGVFVKIINDILSSSDGSMSTALIPILAFILFSLSTYKVFIMLCAAIAMYLMRVSINYAREKDGVSLSIIILNYCSLLIGNFFVSAFVGYTIEKERRLEYILLKRMQLEFQKGQDILANLLPKFVKDRVKQGIRYIAEEQGIVTIMFCDIYGFDKITATHSPKELTDLLDGFFALCDQLCERHGVTKIETVNKTYLICGGLKDSEEHLSPELLRKSHAERTLSLALDIIKKLELVSIKTEEKFRVKIGINTGPILAGVVGEHKPQFSLIGDTINTASRMCSTLKMPDCIQISSTTYEFVKHMNVVFEASHAEAKGKGLLNTFLVSAKPTDNRGKRGTVAPAKKLITATLDQQQPPASNELNESQMPLLSKREDKKEEPVGRTTTVGNSFEDIHKASKDDEEELGLAGVVQWVVCSVRETRERHEYRIACATRDMRSMRIGVWMTVAIFAVVHLVFIAAYIATGESHGSALAIVFRLFSLFAIVAHAIFLTQYYASFSFPWIVVIIYSLASLISTLTLYTIDTSFVYSIVLEVMYAILVVNHISGLPFGFILCANCWSIIVWLLVVLNLYDNIGDSAEPTFFIVIFAAVNMAASYVREAQDRKTYNLNKLATREIQNTETLLKQMMPAHVVKNLKNGIAPTDSYEKVTILYADIVGFTAWSSNRKPIEVVTMLSKLFTTFDHLCVKNHVYKVHTIGDCYVILGFADTGDGAGRDYRHECINVTNMAFDMLKAIKKVNKEKKMNLNMRIGLHTGTLIAGITGTNIVRYDIYGADNDIANKMESGGAAGKINVSEDTRKIIEEMNPGRFEFTFNKVITHEPTNRSLEAFFTSPTNLDELIS